MSNQELLQQPHLVLGYIRDDGDIRVLQTLNNIDEEYNLKTWETIVTHSRSLLQTFAPEGIEIICIAHECAVDYIDNPNNEDE